MESYLFYSSLTLLTMGCLALALSFLFRSKSRALSGLPKNLQANVFNKTFVVFNPYPEQKRMIHEFLLFLPLIVGFSSLGLALALVLIFEAGLMLSFFVAIIGLNLIVLENAPELYQNSMTFINAVKSRSSLGLGDLRVFQIVKTFMPKLSNYYLGLSVLFIASSAGLPYIWSSALWLFAQFMALSFQASMSIGTAAWLLPVFLFAAAVALIQIFVSRIKRKLLGYVTELSSPEEQYIIDHHGYVEHVEPKGRG
jgi:hypothetical protein